MTIPQSPRAFPGSLLQRLFPNLFDPALATRPRADLNAALTGTLTSIPMTLAYGLIIGHALGGQYSGIGVLAALYGSVVVSLAAVLMGGCPLLVVGPRASTMLVFAALIVELKSSSALAGLAEPTLVAFSLACASVACAGLLQILFAAFRFGRLASYVPLPVVAGFINGSALLIIFSQVWPATGIPQQKSILHLFAHLAEIRPATLLLSAATVTLIVFLPRLLKRGPVMLWAVLLANVVYHLGASFGFGPALGGTLPPPPASFSVGFIGSDVASMFSGTHGNELFRLMANAAVTMAILSTLDTLLATSAADGLTMRRSNGGRQLLAEGCGNLVAGMFTMAPGSSSMVRTQAALRAGMVSAAAPLGITFLTLFITAVLGSALTLLSQAVMAGLLIWLGIDLFDKWSLARLRGLLENAGSPKVALGDLLTVTVVVATTLLTDLATAVGVGMLVALLSFVLQMAHSSIRRCYRATVLLPRIHGDLQRRDFIERHGSEIAIVEMEGALFFGSAAELEEQVDGLIRAGVVHVALDLKRVKNIDATGARTLERLNQKLTLSGGLLTIGYVDRERRSDPQGLAALKNPRKSAPRHIWLKLAYLGTIRAIGDGRFCDDIDTAIALCESHLANALPTGNRAASEIASPLPPVLRGVDSAMMRKLRPYLSRHTFAAGARILNQGDAPDAVYFIAAGRVDVVLDLSGTERKLKVQSLSAGSIFGEMALIAAQPRSASVIAQQATRCYCLSTDAMQRLKSDQSDVAFALLTNVAMIFAERLRATNNMLAELEA